MSSFQVRLLDKSLKIGRKISCDRVRLGSFFSQLAAETVGMVDLLLNDGYLFMFSRVVAIIGNPWPFRLAPGQINAREATLNLRKLAAPPRHSLLSARNKVDFNWEQNGIPAKMFLKFSLFSDRSASSSLFPCDAWHITAPPIRLLLHQPLALRA